MAGEIQPQIKISPLKIHGRKIRHSPRYSISNLLKSVDETLHIRLWQQVGVAVTTCHVDFVAFYIPLDKRLPAARWWLRAWASWVSNYNFYARHTHADVGDLWRIPNTQVQHVIGAIIVQWRRHRAHASSAWGFLRKQGMKKNDQRTSRRSFQQRSGRDIYAPSTPGNSEPW